MSMRPDRVNAVVYQTNFTKEEILLLKARINKLRNMKEMNEKRANRTLETASKVYAMRERAIERTKNNSLIVERR